MPGVLNLFNLGFWSLVNKYLRSIIAQIELHCKIYVMRTKPVRIDINEVPVLYKLLDLESISSIDWGKQTKVRDLTKVMSRLVKWVDSGSLTDHLLGLPDKKDNALIQLGPFSCNLSKKFYYMSKKSERVYKKDVLKRIIARKTGSRSSKNLRKLVINPIKHRGRK